MKPAACVLARHCVGCAVYRRTITERKKIAAHSQAAYRFNFLSFDVSKYAVISDYGQDVESKTKHAVKEGCVE